MLVLAVSYTAIIQVCETVMKELTLFPRFLVVSRAMGGLSGQKRSKHE